MKKLCGMRDFREKKSLNAGSGPPLPQGYPSKRVNPSWKAKDSPGLQANFTGRVTLQPGNLMRGYAQRVWKQLETGAPVRKLTRVGRLPYLECLQG